MTMKILGQAMAPLAAAALAAAGLAAATLPASSASAAALRAARMAIPPELDGGERLDLRGLGGGERGRFRLAGSEGRFTRSATRLGILDPLLVRHQGGGSFELAAGGTLPALAGRCRYREGQVNAGPISLTPGRLAYRCEFRRDGLPVEGELILVDPAGAAGRLDGRAVREGLLRFQGREIAIRSVHRDRGGGLKTPTPLGYLLSEGGRPIGAVDVNGSTKRIIAPAGGTEREAVLAASLALAIFWDPAIVQPDG